MHVLQAVSTPEPTPTPTMTVDPDLVTPGPAGFITIVLLALAVGLLAFDMLRRVRRARYREEARLALDAEEAAVHEATDGGESDSGGGIGDIVPGEDAPDKPSS
ncbi:hypothetical protein [Microbacterium halotolerans]|uniref:hypothetical protein n=1 Tax=Microbacterium halotolerans TaxID=246613 RepID=UPI0019697969|nr:hypothetical protein [Microbacterium halotolerans]